MANTKKKSNGRKSNTSSAKKGAETRKKNAEMAQKRKKMITEVNIWVSLGIALLLFLSNFGICGIVGNVLRNVMQGLFGIMGYVFPIVLIVVAGLIAFNLGNTKAVAKIVGTILMFIDGCLISHLIFYGDSKEGILHFYKAGAAGDICGGITGGFFGTIFHKLIGLPGAYIAAGIILIIALVLLTEKSLISLIKRRSQNVYESAKEESKNRREINAEEKKRREERRKERKEEKLEEKREAERLKARGVNFTDTKIEENSGIKAGKPAKHKDNVQEVHEIHIEGIDETEMPDISQDTVTYTYEQAGDNKQIKIDGLDDIKDPVSDEHVAAGEFQPNERIVVSEDAKAAMKRRPYGMLQLEETDGVVTENTVKKAESEGKIIAPVKKKDALQKTAVSSSQKQSGKCGRNDKSGPYADRK